MLTSPTSQSPFPLPKTTLLVYPTNIPSPYSSGKWTENYPPTSLLGGLVNKSFFCFKPGVSEFWLAVYMQ